METVKGEHVKNKDVAQTEAQLMAQLKASIDDVEGKKLMASLMDAIEQTEDARRALAVKRPQLTVIKGEKP